MGDYISAPRYELAERAPEAAKKEIERAKARYRRFPTEANAKECERLFELCVELGAKE